MTVEVNPVGRRCGAKNGALSCTYCYLPLDARLNEPLPVVDHLAVQKVVAGLVPKDGSFSLFGGEPLLAANEDLERLWSFGLETYGKNGVQTGGRPITEKHFEMFHKYKVAVGFSIDGPEELGDARWAGSTEETRRSTAYSISCLERCLKEGIPAGLILTLHRKNASASKLPRLLDWLRGLDGQGLSSTGLHLLEHDGPTRWLALSDEENIAAVLALYELQRKSKTLSFDTITDMIALLRGLDSWKWKDGTDAGVKCVWTACDPMTTPAVQGVDASGNRSLCQRVHKDGIPWGPAQPGPLIRQLTLATTPQENGGCKGCRFLITCKGQCPGTAIGGDWRKRSRDCRVWYSLFEHFEQRMLAAKEIPITMWPDVKRVEDVLMAGWAVGRTMSLVDAIGYVLRGTAVSQTRVGHIDHEDHTDHTDTTKVLTGGEPVMDGPKEGVL
jgi:uncharacterized protein